MDNDQIEFLEQHLYSCKDIEEFVDSYIDGELAPADQKKFNSHIDRCESCQTLVRECQFVVTTAHSIAHTPVPEDVRLRLREALKERVGHNVINARKHLTLIK